MGFRVVLPVSERPVRSSELEDWANKEITPLLKQMRDPENTVQQGNHVLLNIDPLGAGTVRYNVRLAPNRGAAGATETTALYIRTNHGLTYDVEDRFNGGIYMEVDQYQFLAGNGATKTIHRGWGDAHFVALMNTGDRVPITDASNTTPIVITTARKHGFGHANVHQVTGVLGNTAANSDAFYNCRVLDEYRIELWDQIFAPTGPVAGNGLYTGGGQITCINSQVGYEAAHFSENFTISGITSIPGNRGGTAADRAPYVDTIGRANGAVGFLSSIQAGFMPGGEILPDGDLTPGVDVWESGLGRNKLFEALVENDQLFSGACFVASDTPNRAFVAIKRQYFRDGTGVPTGSGIGGFAMFSMEEAYYNPQNNDGSATAAMPRWQLMNDASMRFDALLTSALIPARAAPTIKQFGAYWDGAQSLAYGMWHYFEVTGASAGNYDLYYGRPGFEAPAFRFKSNGTFQMLGGNLDMQSHDIQNVDDMTFTGTGSILDMQHGQVLAVSDLGFRDSLQGQSAASDLTTHTAVLATVAALPACTSSAAAGVGHTLTANAVGVLTVDGVASVLNDVILVKTQTGTEDDNGLYLHTTEGTAGVAFVLTRANDFDEAVAGEIAAGQGVLVSGGATLAGTAWMLDQTGAIVVDTTALTFTQGNTYRNGPDIVLDGTYSAGATSTAYGVRMRFNTVSHAPEGYLSLMFGTPPPGTETPTFFFHDNGNVGIRGTGDATNNYGDGKGVLFMAIAVPEPTADPVGGGIVYFDAVGNLLCRTLAGNVRTLALV